MEELGNMTLAERLDNGGRKGGGDEVDINSRRRRAHTRGDSVASGASHGIERLAIGDVEEFSRVDGSEGDADDKGDKVVTPVNINLGEGDVGPGILVDILDATSGAGVGGGLSVEDAGLSGHRIFADERVEEAASVVESGVGHAGKGRVDTQNASGGEHG